MSAPSDTVEQAERLRISFAREARRVAWRELRAELTCGTLFLVGAVALLALAPPARALSLPIAALYVVALGFAVSVRFEIGAGYMAPTPLVFVPMLFVLPPAAVPVLAAMGLALGSLADAVRGRGSLRRVLVAPANSLFALGPAAVLAFAGAPGAAAGVAVLLA